MIGDNERDRHMPPPPMPPMPPQPGYYDRPKAVPTSGIAVAALLFAIASALGGFLLLLPPLLAIVMGHAATHQTKDGGRGGHGMAIAALIIGYLTLIPGVVIAIWFISAAASA